jgi:hypothetical protein
MPPLSAVQKPSTPMAGYVIIGGNLNDVLPGEGGNDHITAGRQNFGHDTMTGGAGRDTVIFKSVKDSGTTILWRHADFGIALSGRLATRKLERAAWLLRLCRPFNWDAAIGGR